LPAALVIKNSATGAAQALFRAAVSQGGVPWPGEINVDGNSVTHRGLRLLGDEDSRWRGVDVRARQYLDNMVDARFDGAIFHALFRCRAGTGSRRDH
jgi:hypothetical protein